MWLLEHESFNGRREWLKPGNSYLFGRSSASAQNIGDPKAFKLDDKSISRKHMVLRVLEVEPGDGTRLHTRPGIEITDYSCRQGIVVDGTKKLKGDKDASSIVPEAQTIVNGTEHTIRLSGAVPEIRIKWHPTVFTFAAKDGKKHAEKIHELGFKTSNDFIHGQTTHVVAMKRNLPKVLAGLVAGAHIVTSEYLEAIIDIAKAESLDPENYQASKLEQDFDAWWPEEKEYIPGRGTEPVERDAKLLEPDARRSELFSGLTFITFMERQYGSLSEVVSGGGGKLLLFDLQYGATTIGEYVEYARSAAGQKSRGRANNGCLPVVTIQLADFPPDMEEWANNFSNGVDQALNQRSVRQNEFLDAILMKDVSQLQRPAPVIEVDLSMPAKEAPQSSAPIPRGAPRSTVTSQAPESAPATTQEPAKLIPRKRPARRVPTTSRFTGFDDYEPPSKTRKIEEEPMEDIQMASPTQVSMQQPSQSQAPLSTQASRRSATQVVETVEEAVEALNEDELFPAAAAVKKRRAATRAATSAEPETTTEVSQAKPKGAKVMQQVQTMKKKLAREIDVREQLKLAKEEEEKRRIEEEDSVREALEGVDISEIKSRINVEEMEVRVPQRRAAQHTQGRGEGEREGWNDEWNGRKNFKKFRRRGAERGPQPPKVIVPFEEVPQKKGFGHGGAFFLEEPEPSASNSTGRKEKGRKGGARGRAGRAGRTNEESESEPEAGFTRSRRTQTLNEEVIHVEDSMDDDDGVGASTARSAAMNRTQRVAETQMSGTGTQTQRKRGAGSVAQGQPASKRSRPARPADDSDAEETGFRFNRRR